MRRWLGVGAFFVSSFLSFRAPASDLAITEIAAENDSVLLDDDNDYSDWIEVFNVTDHPVSAAGWSLTDDPLNLVKWKFPDVQVAPGGFLVVFASEKDRAVSGKTLHTNFRLEADGEFPPLVEPDGKTIATQFAPKSPQQYDDVSYGVALDAETLTFIT